MNNNQHDVGVELLETVQDEDESTYYDKDKPISLKDRQRKIRRRRLEDILEDRRLRSELEDYA